MIQMATVKRIQAKTGGPVGLLVGDLKDAKRGVFVRMGGLACKANTYAPEIETLRGSHPVLLVEELGVGSNSHLTCQPGESWKRNGKAVYELLKHLQATNIIALPHSAGNHTLMGMLDLIREDPEMRLTAAVMDGPGLPDIRNAYSRGPGFWFKIGGWTVLACVNRIARNVKEVNGRLEMTPSSVRAMKQTFGLFNLANPVIIRNTSTESRKLFATYLTQAYQMDQRKLVPVIYDIVKTGRKMIEQLLKLKEMQVPTMVLGYQHDSFVDRNTGHRLKSKGLLRDDAEVVVVPGESHFGMSANPELVVGKIIEPFLERHGVL